MAWTQQNRMGGHPTARPAQDAACRGTGGGVARPVTTLIIRNIPCHMKMEQLVDIVDGLGFRRSYDLIYVVKTRQVVGLRVPNLGYGFINFLDPASAQAFITAFEGYTFPETNSAKRGKAQPARIQGFMNCLHQIRRSMCGGPLTGAITVSV